MEPLSAIRGYLEQRFAKATYTVRKDHSKREDTEHRNHGRGHIFTARRIFTRGRNPHRDAHHKASQRIQGIVAAHCRSTSEFQSQEKPAHPVLSKKHRRGKTLGARSRRIQQSWDLARRPSRHPAVKAASYCAAAFLGRLWSQGLIPGRWMSGVVGSRRCPGRQVQLRSLEASAHR